MFQSFPQHHFIHSLKNYIDRGLDQGFKVRYTEKTNNVK